MDWSNLADIATVLSAGAAALGLMGTAIGLHEQARANDVSTHFKIFEEIINSERSLRLAKNDEEKVFFLNEHFNRLEAIAHLYNQRKFGSATHELCRDSLLNHLAAFSIQAETRNRLERTVTAGNTYEYLQKFCKENRKALKDREECFKKYSTEITS